MASRVLGLVRDVLFAQLFFGKALDAFALAFTVPNLFRRLFGEGALASALVPVFVRKMESGDREGAARLASRAVGAVAALLGALSGVVVVGSGVVALVAGVETKTGLVAGVLAVVMPYVVLICGAAVLMAYLNAAGHFAMPALAPVLLNVALIAAAVLTSSVWVLALSVLVGGALQYVCQLVPARALGLPLAPEMRLSDPELRGIGRELLPAVAGLAVFQVNVLVDRLLAEVMVPGDGAVGALFLGNRLMQLPLAVFAISVATAAFPELSARAARGDEEGLRRSLSEAAGSILFWTAPAAAGLVLLAEPITALLFDRGSFLAARDALPRTSLVIMFYSPGLVAYGVAGLYARARYAKGEGRAVVRAALISVGVNLALNVALVLVFRELALSPGPGVPPARSGEAGLALASSASGLVYMCILAPGGRDRWSVRIALLWGGGAILAGAATALAGAGVLSASPVRPAWDWLWRASVLPAALCAGSAVALGLALGAADPGMWRPLGRVFAATAGMGIFANLVLSSLPPEGDHWLIPVQRALAPVALGAGAYWFLAGIVAAPEYARARAALPSLGLRRRRARPESG